MTKVADFIGIFHLWKRSFFTVWKVALKNTVNIAYMLHMQQCCTWCLSIYYMKATMKNFPNLPYQI